VTECYCNDYHTPLKETKNGTNGDEIEEEGEKKDKECLGLIPTLTFIQRAKQRLNRSIANLDSKLF